MPKLNVPKHAFLNIGNCVPTVCVISREFEEARARGVIPPETSNIGGSWSALTKVIAIGQGFGGVAGDYGSGIIMLIETIRVL